MKYFCVLVIFLAGCSGWKANWQLRRAEKLINKAEAGGLSWKRDTVWQTKLITIAKLDTTVKAPKIVYDSGKVNQVLSAYDSVKEVLKSKQSTEAQLISARKEIRRLKERIGRGFAKDSIYYVTLDSIRQARIYMRNGTIDSVGYISKEHKQSVSVPVAIKNEIKSEKPRAKWWTWLLIGFFAGAVIVWWRR